MIKKYLSTDYKKAGVDISLLLLRVFGGGFMMMHGWPKFQKVLAGDFTFGDPIGLGPKLSLILTSGAEFFCGLLILIGFGTRIASIPLLFTMIVAAFVVHGSDPFNKKELALAYALVYIALFLMGSGKYSLDQVLFGKKD